MKKSKLIQLLRRHKNKPSRQAAFIQKLKDKASKSSREADIEMGAINYFNGHYPESSAAEHILEAFKP